MLSVLKRGRGGHLLAAYGGLSDGDYGVKERKM